MDVRHYRELEISRRQPSAEAVLCNDHEREVACRSGRLEKALGYALPKSA